VAGISRAPDVVAVRGDGIGIAVEAEAAGGSRCTDILAGERTFPNVLGDVPNEPSLKFGVTKVPKI
jgi:hypothetical protein